MRSFVLSLATSLAFAGVAAAQTQTSTPHVLRGSSAEATKTKATVQKASVARSVQRPPAKPSAAQPQVRAARYGGFMMAPLPPPPVLDTTSPRTLSLINVNTTEALTVTYWSDGSYRRDALDKLNYFLRDTRENQQTEMDPL